MKQNIAVFLLILLISACTHAQVVVPTLTTTVPATPTQVTPSPTNKVLPATATPHPPTATTDPTEAFVTMVMGTKYAGQTAIAAYPTQTATPTIPAESPACRPADLLPGSSSNGAGGQIAVGIGVTNQSSTDCFLPAYPAVQFRNRAGKPLDISYQYWVPNQDPTAGQPTEPARFGLKAGQTAGAVLSWANWCKGAIQGGLVVRLTLLDKAGYIDIPTDLTGGGYCDEPGTRSKVGIMRFETH